MQIDDSTWKRVTKRIDLLERQNENQSELIGGLIRAIKMLSNRLPRASNSSDPFDQCMMGPDQKPFVLPPGLAEELDSPVHKWAIGKLAQDEADDFHTRTRLIWQMREMRSVREARKGPVSCVRKTPGGGSPGANMSL